MMLPSITQLFCMPSLCPLCNQYHQNRLPVCKECQALMQPIGSACQQCALPLPDDRFLRCGHCIKNAPYFDEVIAPFAFEEPLSSLIRQFKYHESLYLTTFLAELMLQKTPPNILTTECLIPIPLHNLRIRKRGFNQAAELAKCLGKSLQIPVELNLCIKKRNTPPQASLDAKTRRKNLKHAFAVLPHRYKHVTLIDDLMTTGNTANELARMLKKQGIQFVTVWCCARA